MRAGRQDVDLYGSLVEKLGRYGEVLTPFVADKSITNLGSEHEGGDREIHDRDVKLLRQCSVVVAEVTQPSLGVGYEIGPPWPWASRCCASTGRRRGSCSPP